MSKDRDLKMDPYGISGAAYRELKYFCLQYEEKKSKLADCYSVGTPILSDTPRGGCTSDPTSRRAGRAMKYSEDCELIEQTAIATSAEFYQYIIKNVGKGYAYDYLGIPLSRTAFYRLRRKFFYMLAIKKNMI